MKRPEEVKLEFTREWVRKAENDFQTAEHLCAGGESYILGTVFHAQQAAEKYLKSFLVWHQIEFQKTHDMEKLLNLAAAAHPKICEVLRDVRELTPYGVEYRYPGDYPDVMLRDAKRALALSRRARKEVRRLLPKEALLHRR